MLAAGSGYAGTVKNQYVWGQIHITMDKSQVVHKAALEFAAGATGAGGTMQAFAGEAPQPADVVEKVDRVLTASTTSAYQPATAATAQEEGNPSAKPAGKMVFAALPDKVPLPSPAPRAAN
jgi:formylmethanofuran dehydrogenase subunit A